MIVLESGHEFNDRQSPDCHRWDGTRENCAFDRYNMTAQKSDFQSGLYLVSVPSNKERPLLACHPSADAPLRSAHSQHDVCINRKQQQIGTDTGVRLLLRAKDQHNWISLSCHHVLDCFFGRRRPRINEKFKIIYIKQPSGGRGSSTAVHVQ